MISPSDNRGLLAAIRTWAAANYPGCPLEYVSIHLRYLPVAVRLADSPTAGGSPELSSSTFEPTDYQASILDALEFCALHTEALVTKVGGDRRRLFRRPGGIHQLRELGLVSLDKHLGYFRPDALPPDLTPESEE